MESIGVLFLLTVLCWLLPGVWAGVALTKYGKWTLLFGGLLLTLYGGMAAIFAIGDAQAIGYKEFEYVGHSMLLFFSVLGSSLIGIALTEIRKSKLQTPDES